MTRVQEERKKERKGKGSEKKDKPISTLRSHPTSSFFSPGKKKRKKEKPIRSPCTTMPSPRVQVLAPLRAENPRRLSRNRSPLPVAFLPLPTISFSSTRAARIHLPPPLPTLLELDSPTSYSRPAESGSRLIIRRVRLDSTDINEERASERERERKIERERDGDIDRGKKEGGPRSEERIEERRVEGSVQTGDTGISK